MHVFEQLQVVFPNFPNFIITIRNIDNTCYTYLVYLVIYRLVSLNVYFTWKIFYSISSVNDWIQFKIDYAMVDYLSPIDKNTKYVVHESYYFVIFSIQTLRI